jgi:hypothetical protein
VILWDQVTRCCLAATRAPVGILNRVSKRGITSWLVAAVIVLAVVGTAVGLGFLLGSDSTSGDSESAPPAPVATIARATTTVARPTTTLSPGQFLGFDGNDGKLTPAEYLDTVESLQDLGITTTLNADSIEKLGAEYCRTLEVYGPNQQANEVWKADFAREILANTGISLDDAFLEEALTIAVLASTRMCSDL